MLRMKARKPWPPEDVATLRAEFPDSRTDDLAVKLGRSYTTVAQKAAKLGLRKSAAYLASADAHRFDGIKGVGSRFTAGHPTWNKGKPGSTGIQEACRATQFKPGRLASEARNYRAIGSLRICADGYLEKKVTDDPDIAPARRWVALHRLVWEAENGPIPRGHIVVFRSGQRTVTESDITLDRLELLTRSENMRRNSVHTNYPPELARLVQLRGALNRQINRKAKEA